MGARAAAAAPGQSVVSARFNELGPRIACVWAFITVDPEDGQEGVVALYSEVTQTWMPLITGDERQLGRLRDEVWQTSRYTGATIKLVRFDQRTELEAYTPSSGRPSYDDFRPA